MKTYTCTKFTGHYPVGVSAVIVAEDGYMAAEILNAALRERGLPGDASYESMVPVIKGEHGFARILTDGNY